MTAQEIAKRFAAGMQDICTPEQWMEIRRRNATPAYANCCATHDFYDANMVMLEAFDGDVWDEAGEAMRAGIFPLWNEAWAIAKRDYLTA